MTDDDLINSLARTKTVRELSRVLLSYLTVEEMAEFIATYLVFKSRGEEEKVINRFVKDQFFQLLKTMTLAIGDWLPDFLTDKDFIKLYAGLPRKFSFRKS